MTGYQLRQLATLVVIAALVFLLFREAYVLGYRNGKTATDKWWELHTETASGPPGNMPDDTDIVKWRAGINQSDRYRVYKGGEIIGYEISYSAADPEHPTCEVSPVRRRKK